MDIVTSNYLPGDPRLIDQIVYELKSQGIFDQFRKECIADVDTKPAYQNLSQRVEGSVMNFLKKQRFSEDMNKNQLREQLRKNISESGFLETGVERIVDQVVNPKINTVFLPKVEDVVYRYLGIEKPDQDVKPEEKLDVDLLPNDLEAISPESVNDHSFNSNSEKKDESIETNENSLNSSNTKTEDESPPFELLEESTKFSVHEDNSVDSHLSGISGLASHESRHSGEIKNDNQMDISQDVSQNSLNSEGNLSIVTSEEDTKMEICGDSNLSENKEIKEENVGNDDINIIKKEIKVEKETVFDEVDTKEKTPEKYEETLEEIKNVNELKTEEKKELEPAKSEEKKTHESRNDSKKSHDKHRSSRSDKERKDDKDKKSRSKSESKTTKDHKDTKSHSKHTSSSKDKSKDYRNGKDKEETVEKDKQVKKDDKVKEQDRSKDKGSKNKEKYEKDRNRSEKDKMAKDKDRSDKEKSHKDKSDKVKSDRDKEILDKNKNKFEKEKGKSDRDKDKVEKDKSDKDRSDRDKINKDKLEKDKLAKEKSSSSKHSKEKLSNLSKKESSNKEKDKTEDKSSRDKSSSSKDKISSSSSKNKDSSKDKDYSKTTKDKDRSKSSSSSSKSKEKDKEVKGSGDSKSKCSDKHKKADKDKSSRHDKSNSSLKKDKDKKVIDDHYSLKDKKSERRSTDRDSNDGSSKMSRNGSFTDSYSQSFKGSSKESSEVFSSGSGDSSNSDKMEENSDDKSNEVGNFDVAQAEVPQAIKYIKPKFASNIHEAMKLMKIRKQLAKLERQNQLSLTQVQAVRESQIESNLQLTMKELSIVLEKSPLELTPAEVDNFNNREEVISSIEPDEERLVLPEKEADGEKSESFQTIICNENIENGAIKKGPVTKNKSITEEAPILKSQDLSMETFEALEARLAQEMSNVNYNMYGEEDDTYEYTSVSFSPVKKRKASNELKHPSIKKVFCNTSNIDVDNDQEIEFVVSKQFEEPTHKVTAINSVFDSTISTDNKEIELVNKQDSGPSEEISFKGNGVNVPVTSDSFRNVIDKEIVVIDQQVTQEMIIIGGDQSVLTISASNTNISDMEIEEVIDKQIKESTEEIIIYDSNVDTDSVVNQQVNDPTEEINTTNSDEIDLIIIPNSPEQICDISEQVEVSTAVTEVPRHQDNNIIETGEELVTDKIHEKCMDHVQETIINDNDSNLEAVESTEELEEDMEYFEEIVIHNDNKAGGVEIEKSELDSDHHEDLEEVDVYSKFNDEFRGFDDANRDNTSVVTFIEKISDMERNFLAKLNAEKTHITRNYVSKLAEMENNTIGPPNKEDGIILRHDLSIEAAIKEVTNMSPTIQDLLQKNGKKLFIKIDKLEHKLPSKVLVSFQDMEMNGIVGTPLCEVNNVSHEENSNNQEIIAKAGQGKLLEYNIEETNQNGQMFKKPLDAVKPVLPPKSNNNGLIEKDYIRSNFKWEDDDSPCYCFDNSNSKNEEHLNILNDMIGRLEKAVEKQSLQMQNNIPSVKKRGKKRKAESTENNNSINAQCKSEPKRHSKDFMPHQNGENLCNTNISQNQSFSLPLSPADSEKSDDHKKEEPVTVKTKRTGRVSNTKRYSSEDLYKPRPVLRCGGSRRRSAKLEHKP